jgi:hypothetical protein
MAPRKGLSFKKQKRETGLRGVGNTYPDTVIRLDGRRCGTINAPNWRSKDGLWRVSLTRKTSESFEWVFFKARFPTEAEARSWVIEKWDTLKANASPLHSFEDDY